MDSTTVPAAGQADYGLDAPDVMRNLIIGGGAGMLAGVAVSRLVAPSQPALASWLLNWGLWGGGLTLLSGVGMAWSSKVGKLREREQLLDLIAWRGDETVLDVGCGRGLLLSGAARRLTTGKAVGLDLWQAEDQSGNSPEATLANARAEGVADRVEVKTGDMRHMPFEDNTFDVAVSSLALHNIYDEAERVLALREIDRVLKPGGRVALLDFMHTEEYAQVLRELGWPDAQRTGLRFGMYPPVRVVTGMKPT
jgi:arsenite methyltransferase